MFTTSENRPLVGKVFAVTTILIGSVGALITLAAFGYVLAIGRSSDASGVAALVSAGSVGVLVLGMPCGVYALYCGARSAWLGLVLCLLPFLGGFLLSALAGGSGR
jgi:hypothetical protein